MDINDLTWIKDQFRELGSPLIISIPDFLELLLKRYNHEQVSTLIQVLEEKQLLNFYRGNSIPPFWIWDDQTWEKEKYYCYRHGVSNKMREDVRKIAKLTKGKVGRWLRGEIAGYHPILLSFDVKRVVK